MGLGGCSTVDYHWQGLPNGLHTDWHVPEGLNTLLAQTPACCASLADLPYQPVARQGTLDIEIGKDSPVFGFETGKSRFAAYRLPDWPRPLTVQLDSFRAAEPGSAGILLHQLRGLIFHPRVLILDQRHLVSRVIDQFSPGEECMTTPFSPAMSARFEIDTSPSESAYLVILTSDALRQEIGTSVCGGTLHGYSPIGKLELTLGSLGFGDGKIAYKGSYIWYENAHGRADVGIFSGMFRDHGTLLVTGDGIHYVEWTSKGYVERFAAPYERLVSVTTGGIMSGREHDLLVLGIAADKPGEVNYHTFEAARESSPSQADMFIKPHIRPDWFHEMIGLSVADTAPVVEILENKRISSGASERIADSAAVGGVVLAFPCGVCTAGACPPEALAPCAALFAVGATVGGLVGIGNELVSGGVKPTPQSPRIPETAAIATLPAMQSAAMSRIGGPALQPCLLRHLPKDKDRKDPTATWHSQARTAGIVSVAWDSAASEEKTRYARLSQEGYRYVMEVHIDRLSLVPEGTPGQSLGIM